MHRLCTRKADTQARLTSVSSDPVTAVWGWELWGKLGESKDRLGHLFFMIRKN